jgi:hypothetical protein
VEEKADRREVRAVASDLGSVLGEEFAMLFEHLVALLLLAEVLEWIGHPWGRK